MAKTKFRGFLWITWAGRPRPYFRTSSAPNSPFMAWFGAVNEQGNVCTSDSRKSVCVPNEDRGCAWNWNILVITFCLLNIWCLSYLNLFKF